MSATRPPGGVPGGPANADLERFLERVPAAHRPALRAAVDQWSCAMWLAATQVTGGDRSAAAGLASAPVLSVYGRFLDAVAGRGIGPNAGPAVDTSARTRLAEAYGELAGTLARLASEAISGLEPPAAGDDRGAAPLVRGLYDAFVERWEIAYREWMLSDDFARLQATLCNEALALRRRDAEPDR